MSYTKFAPGGRWTDDAPHSRSGRCWELPNTAGPERRRFIISCSVPIPAQRATAYPRDQLRANKNAGAKNRYSVEPRWAYPQRGSRTEHAAAPSKSVPRPPSRRHVHLHDVSAAGIPKRNGSRAEVHATLGHAAHATGVARTHTRPHAKARTDRALVPTSNTLATKEAP